MNYNVDGTKSKKKKRGGAKAPSGGKKPVSLKFHKVLEILHRISAVPSPLGNAIARGSENARLERGNVVAKPKIGVRLKVPKVSINDRYILQANVGDAAIRLERVHGCWG